MYCPHFAQKQCQSCSWLDQDYVSQIAQKQQHLQQQLVDFIQPTTVCFSVYESAHQAMRNRAKMVVSGAVERPIFGILPDPQDSASAVDLTDCPLYPDDFQPIFMQLKDFVARAGLVPYNIAKRKGELKYILLTKSQFNQQYMLRFVLRSEVKLPLIQRELPALLQKLPQIVVVSANIQPQPAAILEGEKEIYLTEQQMLAEQFNQITLFIRPQGFFQTNPQVAAALYRTAQQWTQALPIQHIWDLFCGVGGFGLHCAAARQQLAADVSLVGIEISASAIQAAKLAAEHIGLTNVRFQDLDASQYQASQGVKPDLVIVNPPRRGIGQSLADYLNQLQPRFLLYSSCNVESMRRDLYHLSSYRLTKLQLFDMFPHTSHYEVLGLLELA
ncbi:23S rRNA methyltransferase [Gallibacterium salpingitidis]|uniref:23S rRNA (uracil(747)-C(5))-methyltransferase RlmC n=1 Tax=Gallibacterium salpingitidis TaxID=505341 RepID=A0AB36E2W4_9PAST|nr:23S rRNA (uracil(747)-C(5))-methyltransferase RlmC [Gallibacterium salpingitidis]OBX09241.1 23S rRNA methyltransferase [Gallibacterium salpingitidis]OBX10638.1 23S rRNA methyltransferase [Gallibacterium salpingitidis]